MSALVLDHSYFLFIFCPITWVSISALKHLHVDILKPTYFDTYTIKQLFLPFNGKTTLTQVNRTESNRIYFHINSMDLQLLSAEEEKETGIIRAGGGNDCDL